MTSMPGWNTADVIALFAECADIARRIKTDPAIRIKDDRTPVSDADQDIEKLLCFAGNAPATASIGQRYFNSTTKKIYTYGADGWGSAENPAANHVYFNLETSNLYTWGGNTMLNMSSTGSIVVQTTSQRTAYIPAIGAIIYDSTDHNVYVGDGVTPGGVIVNSDLYTQVAALAAQVQYILDGEVPVQGSYHCGPWTDNAENVTAFGAWTP